MSLALLLGLGWVYVRTHPLLFMATHVHCITFAGLSLGQSADRHDGRYPYHPNGYGNALLLLDEDCFYSLTGPGYEATRLRDARMLAA